MEFSRQQYKSGLPSPPPEDLPDPGMEIEFLASSFIDKQILYQLCNLGSSCPRQYIIFLKKLFSFPCLLCFTFHVCVCWVGGVSWSCVCLFVPVWSWGWGLFLHQGCNLAPHMVSELMGNLNLRVPCLSGPLRNEAVDPTLPKLTQSCILFGVNLRH